MLGRFHWNSIGKILGVICDPSVRSTVLSQQDNPPYLNLPNKDIVYLFTSWHETQHKENITMFKVNMAQFGRKGLKMT